MSGTLLATVTLCAAQPVAGALSLKRTGQNEHYFASDILTLRQAALRLAAEFVTGENHDGQLRTRCETSDH